MDKIALKKKLENIWYYYSRYIILGLFLLFIIVYGLLQKSTAKNEDVSVLYIGSGVSSEALCETIEKNFSYCIKDINNDDKKQAAAVELVSSKNAEGDLYLWQRVDVDLVGGRNRAVFVDDDLFLKLKERNAIVPFNISDDERVYYIDITDNPCFKDCFNNGRRVYLCEAREPEGKRTEEEKKLWDNGGSLLEEIIKSSQKQNN